MVKHDDHAMTWYDHGDSYSPWYHHAMNHDDHAKKHGSEINNIIFTVGAASDWRNSLLLFHD